MEITQRVPARTSRSAMLRWQHLCYLHREGLAPLHPARSEFMMAPKKHSLTFPFLIVTENKNFRILPYFYTRSMRGRERTLLLAKPNVTTIKLNT